MRDGLYRVLYRGICAGFLIENGKLVRCAPILQRKFNFFLAYSERISA